MKVLISDSIHDSGIAALKAADLEVDNRPGLDAAELVKIIGQYEALIVRSATQVTAEVLDAAGDRLRVVGRAGIGVDNIDIETATQRGVVVMNTPGGNAVTAAEHAIALMLSVARRIPQAAASMREGKWEKKKFMGTEITGKTLGIVGLGNIGRIVAQRARGLEMHVVVFDPFLSDEAAVKAGIEKVSLDQLLAQADFVTVHTPLTEDTRDLINKGAFAKCKKGVVFINAARGGIINEADLVAAIEDGTVAGAGMDVFVEEPPPEDHPFRARSEIVMTPHLGASTAEAQEKVAAQIASQIAAYLNSGEIRHAVNFPPIGAEMLKLLKPYLVLAERMGSLVGQLTLATGAVTEVAIDYQGDVADRPVEPLTAALLKGLLSPMLDRSVNYVNAPVIARDRGIRVRESLNRDREEFTALLTLSVKAGDTRYIVSGTVVGQRYPRVVRFNDFYLEAVPEGHILVMRNHDVPGVVGSLGTLLGKRDVNIARLQLGRGRGEGDAVSFLNVDARVPDEVIQEIAQLPHIVSVQQVYLE